MSFIAMKTLVISSSSLPNHNSSAPSPQPNDSKLPLRRISPAPQQQKRKQKKPSVIEIERAIGSGIFKDRIPGESERNMSMFDVILSNSIGRTEGSVERKLRESGEWMVKESERTANSTGKRILIGMFLCVIPMAIFLFIASGTIKLPLSNPYLDDLIM